MTCASPSLVESAKSRNRERSLARLITPLGLCRSHGLDSEIMKPTPRRYGELDHERWVDEDHRHSVRSEFARDRARVVHSAALRRLGAKTQVLTPGDDDFSRTRLTHSLEVAQVGRELGEALGCDPDVVDTACLAHDLGHPPFGHNGESALAALSSEIGGFEGNAQTFRILTRLEPKISAYGGNRFAGVNLTRASLDAVIKYPWGNADAPPARGSTGSVKFGVYSEDLEVFTWARDGAPNARRCVEAQIMDVSDDISYSVHDVEDAIVGGHLNPQVLTGDDEQARLLAMIHDRYAPPATDDELSQALERLISQRYWVWSFDGTRRALAALKNMTSQLIGRFCGATERMTRERYGAEPLVRYAADVMVPAATSAEIAVLKGIAALHVMSPREHDVRHVQERRILTELVERISDAPTQIMESQFYEDWKRADNDAGRHRVVIDQVASLTDQSARALLRSLTSH